MRLLHRNTAVHNFLPNPLPDGTRCDTLLTSLLRAPAPAPAKKMPRPSAREQGPCWMNQRLSPTVVIAAPTGLAMHPVPERDKFLHSRPIWK